MQWDGFWRRANAPTRSAQGAPNLQPFSVGRFNLFHNLVDLYLSAPGNIKSSALHAPMPALKKKIAAPRRKFLLFWFTELLYISHCSPS